MSRFKEIVTKAVIGKGKKTTTNNFSITTEQKPDTVLGCWVINHTFNGTNTDSNVEVNGAFDINVWYSHDNDTKTAVSTRMFSYNDKMNLRLKENTSLGNNPEVIVRSLKQPTVTDVSIEDGVVLLNVEKEMGIEIVGEAKVRIETMDDEDDYEVIVDDEIPSVSEAELEQIDEIVEENYIK